MNTTPLRGKDCSVFVSGRTSGALFAGLVGVMVLLGPQQLIAQDVGFGDGTQVVAPGDPVANFPAWCQAMGREELTVASAMSLMRVLP
jgi:hypothetical protein